MASSDSLCDEEIKAKLIDQVLELQTTLDELSTRVDSVKNENDKLKSENLILTEYIENLMSSNPGKGKGRYGVGALW
eukprot:m.17886 g.17886  ORF g.17886 m.17886 type:complete len:77 (-) comp11334_c0_seq2:1487-1717(-)